jgi:hypothetical protein
MLVDRNTLTLDTKEVVFIPDVSKFLGCSLILLYLDTERLQFLCMYSNLLLIKAKVVKQDFPVFRSHIFL